MEIQAIRSTVVPNQSGNPNDKPKCLGPMDILRQTIQQNEVLNAHVYRARAAIANILISQILRRALEKNL